MTNLYNRIRFRHNAFPFRWDQLRRIGSTRVAKLIALLPILTYGLSIYFEIRNNFDWLQYTNIGSLGYVFVGTTILAVGTFFYSIMVPYQVVKHIDDVEFYLAEKDAWWNSERMDVLYKIPWESPHRPGDHNDQIEVTRKYYRYLCDSKFIPRLIVSILYVLGLLTTSMPIIKKVIEVFLLLTFGDS
ncbi:MAG: hypothetical protein ABJG78_12635 [Cyclobacteriaceae bacterium]